MKYIFLIPLIFIGFLASLLMTSNDVNGQTEFKEYVSEPLGVKLQIPPQWQVIDRNENEPENCFSEDKNCSIIMMNDEFVSGNVSFTTSIQKYSFNGSLKDFLNYKYNIFEKVKGFTFLADQEMKFKDNPAWQIEYTYAPLGQTLKQMSIFTQVNNTFYELVYTSMKESDYSKYLQEAQNVLNTIEFIPSKPPEIKKPSFFD